MEKRINEEIRQYKLFKIQETESKLRKFQKAYSEIKEHIGVKFSKNLTSNLFRIILGGLALTFFLLAVISFFANDLISYLESNGEHISIKEKEDILNKAYFLKYIFIILSVFLMFTGYLLKINIKKRNNLYSLSLLLEEIMTYMENSSKDDKLKYEHFVDSLAEQEQIKNNMF